MPPCSVPFSREDPIVIGLRSTEAGDSIGNVNLVEPSQVHLDSYCAALKKGWSSNTMTPVFEEELAAIAADSKTFLSLKSDRDAAGPPIKQPDGSFVKRLPGFHMWMWDGEFCGSINLRWVRGSNDLPQHIYGHIGYTVVPWKQGLGYATAALAQILPLAKLEGLQRVEITTDVNNIASQKVIENNGGVLVERFEFPKSVCEDPGLRYRIEL